MSGWNTPRRQARIALGMCPDCGESESAPGGKRCTACKESQNQRHRKLHHQRRAQGIERFTSEKYANLAEEKRQIRAERRAQGLCVQCGREAKRFSRCTRCRAGMAIVKRNWRTRHAAKEGKVWQSRQALGEPRTA